MTRQQRELKEMDFGVCIMVIRLWKGATTLLQQCFLSNGVILSILYVNEWAMSPASFLVISVYILY